jgi:hypothetical protein
LKFSCITFGSPPILNTDITEALHAAPELQDRLGVNLAFVNEFDIVPRSDQTYIRSLIDIYRSIYNLPPLMDNAIREPDTNAENNEYVLPPLEFDDDNVGERHSIPAEGNHWKLPKAEYHIIGDIVLLRKVRMTTASEQILLAQSIAQEEFQKLVYCGNKNHSRTYYSDRVELMLEGKFNHRLGW